MERGILSILVSGASNLNVAGNNTRGCQVAEENLTTGLLDICKIELFQTNCGVTSRATEV